MGNIVDITSKIVHDAVSDMPTPDEILTESLGQLETCIILGWDNDETFYTRASSSDGPNLLWLLELAKKRLMGD